jgi:hypothetical protein
VGENLERVVERDNQDEWRRPPWSMEMLDLPVLAECPRKSLAERLARTNLPHSIGVINPGQFVISRDNEDYSEGGLVGRLNMDPAL